MNCFIWILLLLGCGGNCGNNNCYSENTRCRNTYNRCNRNRCDDNRNDCNNCEEVCDNLIQPRNNDDCDCGCRHQHHHHNYDNGCMTPPPVPRYVMQEDDCGCNN